VTEQFIQRRKYLKPVLPKTLIWYKCSLAAFSGAIGSRVADRGVSPITI